ncbi:MAG TPA: lytic murein transglycosylase [Candidatus Paceibacterota bacterium]
MRFRPYISIFLICFFLLSAFNFLLLTPALAQDLTPAQRAELQAEYDKTLKEIDELQGTIDNLRQQQKSLKGDISLLTAQINQAEAVLKQKTIVIRKLATEINAKTQRINTLTAKIEQGKISLAELIRKTNELDSYSLPEAMLSDKDFSEFFADIDSFNSIQKSLAELFAAVREAKAETEKEKRVLDEKKNQEEDAKYVVELKKKEVAKNQSEKKQLLAVNTTQENAYNLILADKQQKAERIRTALFNLRDTEGISFGVALTYANAASQKTGVRPALILAILSQESDMGKNVGSCYIKNLQTGDGVGKNTGTFFERVMKVPRDTEAFQRITDVLRLPWATTPVSCPLGTAYTSSRGYGGAMGPSQFIPSTWELFKQRIAKAIGVSEPNPWQAQDAVMATAIYLMDLGAAGGTYTAERNASCRYYSGRSCDNRRPANSFYGTGVLQKAEQIQGNIDFLKSV